MLKTVWQAGFARLQTSFRPHLRKPLQAVLHTRRQYPPLAVFQQSFRFPQGGCFGQNDK